MYPRDVITCGINELVFVCVCVSSWSAMLLMEGVKVQGTNVKVPGVPLSARAVFLCIVFILPSDIASR